MQGVRTGSCISHKNDGVLNLALSVNFPAYRDAGLVGWLISENWNTFTISIPFGGCAVESTGFRC